MYRKCCKLKNICDLWYLSSGNLQCYLTLTPALWLQSLSIVDISTKATNRPLKQMISLTYIWKIWFFAFQGMHLELFSCLMVRFLCLFCYSRKFWLRMIYHYNLPRRRQWCYIQSKVFVLWLDNLLLHCVLLFLRLCTLTSENLITINLRCIRMSYEFYWNSFLNLLSK